MPYVNRIIYSYGDHPHLHSVSIYYQGCDRQPKCAFCHNPQTWEPFRMFNLTDDEVILSVEDKLLPLISNEMKAAIVFLGGEPLAPYNRDSVYAVSKYFKMKFGDLVTTMLYTWRYIEDLKQEDLLKFVQYIDEFVLGPYIHELRVTDDNGNIKFPVSSNQLYVNKLYILETL